MESQGRMRSGSRPTDGPGRRARPTAGRTDDPAVTDPEPGHGGTDHGVIEVNPKTDLFDMTSLAPRLVGGTLDHTRTLSRGAAVVEPATAAPPPPSATRGDEQIAPLVSVIVPTRHEAENLPVLFERLGRVEIGSPMEVLVVDDSDDDTPQQAARAAARLRRPDYRIRIAHRSPEDREGGLSGAVAAGMAATSAPWICVMDGDLQHPPELVAALVAAAIEGDRDLVVASRYCEGGSSQGLQHRYRRATSRAATAVAHVGLPPSLRQLSDPMSGFFVVRRDAIDLDRLQPRGFKILLEILGRHPHLRVGEVPFEFGARHAGHSKASAGQALHLVRQAAELHRAAAPPTHRYDIHGIVGVESDRRLPELTKFAVDRLGDGPRITVRVGSLRGLPKGENIDLTGDVPAVSYVERAGFGMRVKIQGTNVEVDVTPSVARSPHVLYTNVVEPLLRWLLVSLDHALVHAACIADGEHAYLVTARTDTGKTTTMLKVLDRAPLSFMSDDLVVVRRDGTVLTYPKPLTISAHTVHALRSTDLNRRERIALVPQSRLHSREGRQFAFLLTRYRLPVASISAMIQRLVPPPKYHVERLVLGVASGQRARIRGMFVIQRGGLGGEPVAHDEALEILLANCADAFGFPPYDSLERLVLSVSPDDLRTKERWIIAEALGGVPTELMRSETLDWAERIVDRILLGSNGSVDPPMEILQEIV